MNHVAKQHPKLWTDSGAEQLKTASALGANIGEQLLERVMPGIVKAHQSVAEQLWKDDRYTMLVEPLPTESGALAKLLPKLTVVMECANSDGGTKFYDFGRITRDARDASASGKFIVTWSAGDTTEEILLGDKDVKVG